MRYWRAARSKGGRPYTVTPDELPEYCYIAAPRRMAAFLVVDLDRPTGVLDAYQVAAEIGVDLAWVIETHAGRAQAAVLIDPVDMRPTLRTGAQRYVAAVGRALRSAFDGDAAVDPVTPVRFRNPLYAHADAHLARAPRTYRLRELQERLASAGHWEQRRRRDAGSPVATVAVDPGGMIPAGERNSRVFDACRFAAYRGEDHVAAAWAAFERCDQPEDGVPFTEREVTGIIASVERFMQGRSAARRVTTASTSMPESMREALSEMGKTGGSRNSQAQQEARARGRAAVSARASARAERARELASGGRTRREIAAELGVSVDTVKRALRAPRVASGGGVQTGASGVADTPSRRPPAAPRFTAPVQQRPEWDALGDPAEAYWTEVASLAAGTGSSPGLLQGMRDGSA